MTCNLQLASYNSYKVPTHHGVNVTTIVGYYDPKGVIDGDYIFPALHAAYGFVYYNEDGPSAVGCELRVATGGASRVFALHEDVGLGRRGGGEPRLGQPRLQERARRGGHGGGARAEDGRGLVRVGRAQVELEAATASRAGLEGDAQLELARHADAVGGHDREPREQRGVEEPRARAGPALLLAQLVLTHGAGAGSALAALAPLAAVRHPCRPLGCAAGRCHV